MDDYTTYTGGIGKPCAGKDKKIRETHTTNPDEAVGRNGHEDINMMMKTTNTQIVINSESTRLNEWVTDFLPNRSSVLRTD